MWDNPHGLVFTSELDGPLEHWRVETRFQAAAKAAGLEGVRFHDTRHPNVKPKTQIFLGKQKVLIIIKKIIRTFCIVIVPHTNCLVQDYYQSATSFHK